MTDPNVIIVGAGFAGAVLAERFASEHGSRVLILERRHHIAGNAFDYLDDVGIFIHKFGPKIFRTDNEEVWRYLNRFTSFNGYEHHVRAMVDGRLLPVPFNLTAIERVFPAAQAAALKAKLVAELGLEAQIPIADLCAHRDPELAALGRYVFEKIYRNYTVKQWGEKPEQLDFATITRRVPVRVTYDNRYFHERHQGLPSNGYTQMFARILDHPKIEVRLGVEANAYLQVDHTGRRMLFEGKPFQGLVIYTGPLDELFEYVHGELPYRSLEFALRTLPQDRFQEVGVVNFPNEHAYTRITEYKTLTRQTVPGRTTIAEEYPLAYDRRAARGNEPYYPIPAAKNEALVARYNAMAAPIEDLVLVGRLAEYRYYDMNDIIVRALSLFRTLSPRLSQSEQHR